MVMSITSVTQYCDHLKCPNVCQSYICVNIKCYNTCDNTLLSEYIFGRYTQYTVIELQTHSLYYYYYI